MRFLSLGLCLLTTACQADQPGDETVVPAVVANSPEGIVRRIYTLPVPNFSAFHEPAQRDEFYSPATSDLIAEAENCVADRLGLPHLEFDFIVPGNDFQLTDLEVSLPEPMGAQSADVLVSFRNGGEFQQLLYQLQRRQQQWRIHDVRFQSLTLRGELRAACGAQ